MSHRPSHTSDRRAGAHESSPSRRTSCNRHGHTATRCLSLKPAESTSLSHNIAPAVCRLLRKLVDSSSQRYMESHTSRSTPHHRYSDSPCLHTNTRWVAVRLLPLGTPTRRFLLYSMNWWLAISPIVSPSGSVTLPRTVFCMPISPFIMRYHVVLLIVSLDEFEKAQEAIISSTGRGRKTIFILHTCDLLLSILVA